MKFAAIVPTPMLPSIEGNDYHMVLAGKCETDAIVSRTAANPYASFYALEKGFKILDNGAAEGQMLTTKELLWWTDKLEADEVVIPDVMHDAYASSEMITTWHRETFRVFKQERGMAVLQAKTWYEFNLILDTALRCHVASVALPKLLCSHLGSMARVAAAETIRKRDADIPIHCLGCPSHVREVRDLARQGIVRGIDTAAPVVLGLQGVELKHAEYDWEVSHRAIDNYWEQEMTPQVRANLDQFKAWCGD